MLFFSVLARSVCAFSLSPSPPPFAVGCFHRAAGPSNGRLRVHVPLLTDGLSPRDAVLRLPAAGVRIHAEGSRTERELTDRLVVYDAEEGRIRIRQLDEKVLKRVLGMQSFPTLYEIMISRHLAD